MTTSGDVGAANQPLPHAHTLALVALSFAVLQAVAVVLLGTSEVDDVKRAAAEGSRAYVLATLISIGCLWGVFGLRRRPTLSLPLLLAWPLLVYLPLRNSLSPLGLAYHGEFIAYHFLGLVGAVLCLWIPLRWALDPSLRIKLGVTRWIPLGLAGLGTLALVVSHVAGIPGLRLGLSSQSAAIGAMLMLAAWTASVGVTWKHAEPGGHRLAAALLLVPVLVRVLATGDGGPLAGLRGAPVRADLAVWLGIAIVIVSGLVAGLVRPKLELLLHGLVALVCMIAVAMLWGGYTYMFGVLEDGLDGIARSFLGFSLPYPAYAAGWKVTGMMLGIFFILVTVYTCLVSTRDRDRGVALGLLTVAGIGLSSPHLVLLMAAGIFSFIDTLIDPVDPPADDDDDGDQAPAARQEPTDLDALVEHVARRLGAAQPVSVDALSMLRDDIDGVAVDLRARGGRKPELQLTVGLPGRATPEFELVPDRGQGGQRPAHLLARSHRLVGDARVLEHLGDRPLDALTRLPGARVRAWEAGWEIELHEAAIDDADADALESLIRAVVQILRRG